MSILVVAAIAVMVLLVLGVLFTGGFKQIGANIMHFVQRTGGSEAATAQAACNTWCFYNSTEMEQEDPDGCASSC